MTPGTDGFGRKLWRRECAFCQDIWGIADAFTYFGDGVGGRNCFEDLRLHDRGRAVSGETFGLSRCSRAVVALRIWLRVFVFVTFQG